MDVPDFVRQFRIAAPVLPMLVCLTVADAVVAAPPAEPTPLAVPFNAIEARASQTAWASYLDTTIRTVIQHDMQMVLIPAGSFLSSPGVDNAPSRLSATARSELRDDHRPGDITGRVSVVIERPFRIGATEVTVGQFTRFVEATGYQTEAEVYAIEAQSKQRLEAQAVPASGRPRRTYRDPGFPVTNQSPAKVSWNDASAFCRWLSEQEHSFYRLPSEAEWEFACRAGAATTYFFGDDVKQLQEYAWYGNKSGGRAHDVGTRKPNAFGLYDMHGNLWEWCRDRFDESADSHYVLRGGYFRSPAPRCGCGYRNTPRRYFTHAFRCVNVLPIAAE